jgi:hypothetical protein
MATLSHETAVETYSSILASATTEQREQARAWYPSARVQAHALSLSANWTLEQSAAVIAAYSPRVSWAHNLRLAWNHALGMEVRCLGASKRRAANAAQHGFCGLGNGAKVNAFARNIAGISDDVTIDTWMLRPFGLKSANKGNYRILANAVRELAWRQGIPPSEMQALLWIIVRGRDE